MTLTASEQIIRVTQLLGQLTSALNSALCPVFLLHGIDAGHRQRLKIPHFINSSTSPDNGDTASDRGKR
ncbi:hypothetical protein [Rhodanobacter sp. A1T4]|uniref:hypothetical protein n=1 Tax=Rhodanobacter sp. A1T4 TaxID=2723087 RepID=UPI0016150242|nr:hypothetical protein [Rhodanobacter sp. A1T4]MBB6247821.1 hypothetical protein [Rhodanobacter sp. A1T4]